MRRGHKSLILGGGIALCLIAGGVGFATAPTVTKQGVNYRVSKRAIPRYVKAIDFLHRHEQYTLLASEITKNLSTDRERVLAVFEWTRQHIQKTPADWPVVDDHIWHIIVRGHGLDDQMADVFTTLTTYAGVPAFWRGLRPEGTTGGVVLSFAWVDQRWRAFDVARGLIFRDANGELASVEELAAQPELVAATAGDLRPGGLAYHAYVAAVVPLEIPDPLRAELQMPGVRLWHETRRALGLVKQQEVPLFVTLATGSSQSDN